MIRLEGLSASLGIVIGPVFFFEKTLETEIPRYAITQENIENEWQRFNTALELSRSELELLYQKSGKEQKEILQTHLLMLSDPEFIDQIKKELYTQMQNIEAILQLKIEEAIKMLRSTTDLYLSERSIDIEDAFGRVLGHLTKQKTGVRTSSTGTGFVPPGTILVSQNLLPSEALALKDSGIAGIILEEGGATSHVAILARSWQVPAVMGVRNAMNQLTNGEQIILDAHDGLIISKPTKTVLNLYLERANAQKEKTKKMLAQKEKLITAPTETTDGVRIWLHANAANNADGKQALDEGAEGIGLFRSEFLFVGKKKLPTEQEQYKVYADLARNMKSKPVVFRTLDVGADKMIEEQLNLKEKNPLLGWRAIRYCLDRREIFKTQLRAMLRASTHGNVHIMFPMITNIEELDAVLDVLDEVKRNLVQENYVFNTKVKIGIMIEVPSAAICADLFAQKVDFLSIGTNDLVQYTMAVDRENTKVAHLFDYFNPAVLRLIKMTIDAGCHEKIEVSICGEMASDITAVPLLIGLGLKNLSMSPSFLLQVKNLILKINFAEAKELADSAIKLSAAREVRKLLQEKIKTYE